MKLRKYTLKQLKEAIKTSYSYRETLLKLKVKAAGGNYAVLQKAIKHFNLDTSHFKGLGWSKGKSFGPKRPIEEYLNNEFSITSHRLRLRLIKEGYFQHQCQSCKSEKWLNQPIPLELDHIDGNHKNNNLSNLRLLCPNCHAFTPTYRGRKKKKTPLTKVATKTRKRKEIGDCPVCGNKKKSNKHITCSAECAGKRGSKVDWAIYDDLLREEIKKKTPLTKIGQMIGISDNGVRKRAKKTGFL